MSTKVDVHFLVVERPLTRDDFEAARVASDLRGVRGTVFVGEKCTVYLVRNEKSRFVYAGWWLHCGTVQEQVRTEKQGRKLARQWAANGFPSETP